LIALARRAGHNLQTALDILRREVRSCLPDDVQTPALQLLHAVPVYYGTTVTACAQLEVTADTAALAKSCPSAGFSITAEDAAPDNICFRRRNLAATGARRGPDPFQSWQVVVLGCRGQSPPASRKTR